MARRDRPLKVVRSKPQTHKEVLEELRKRQSDRNKPAQSPPKPIQPNPSLKAAMPKVRRPVKTEKVLKQVKANIQEQKDTVHSPKKLCIGTIFPDCGKLGEQWLDLQLRYIKATTKNFHHVSLVQNGSKISSFFSNNTEVIRPLGQRNAKNSQAHTVGLNGLHAHFIKHQANYDHFLFIDMDAFPIRKNWYDILVKKLGNNWELAIALRCENLETRLHSSILFATKPCLQHLKWGVHKVGVDLIGKSESDVNLMSHQTKRRKQSYVLLRSNQYQIHPLLCGVYYDLFYHHGCGSGRQFNMRSRPYWGHIVPQKFDVMGSIDKLMEDPNEFIGKLAGWHRSEYPQV